MPKDKEQGWPEAAFEPTIPPEAAPAPAETPAQEKPAEPVAQSITVDRFVQTVVKGRDAVTIAFVSCEKRAHGVRKLPGQKWQELLTAFLSAERR